MKIKIWQFLLIRLTLQTLMMLLISEISFFGRSFAVVAAERGVSKMTVCFIKTTVCLLGYLCDVLINGERASMIKLACMTVVLVNTGFGYPMIIQVYVGNISEFLFFHFVVSDRRKRALITINRIYNVRTQRARSRRRSPEDLREIQRVMFFPANNLPAV